ncbi:MAG TPA: tetratricopeptide repeat protein [Rhodocyclaceae bacterium]|nr:tetratricopeptide repeat protein [Rhodocyclaceae bacterium]
MDTQQKARELFFLAQDARKNGCHAEAETYLREALIYAPGRESVRTNLCGALIDQKKHAEALGLCKDLVIDFPANAVAWHRLSLCQFATDQMEEALESVKRCIDLAPDNIDALVHRIAILLRMNDNDAALQTCRDAVEHFPQDASLRTALGVVYGARREFDQALECHDIAMQFEPENPDKRWNLALVQLMLGNQTAGWRNMEARWTTTNPAEMLYVGDAPRWDGSSPLRNRKIVVWGEQGLGDTIQFCRFIPHFLQSGANVIFQVPTSLYTLMRDNLPSVTVVAEGQLLPPHDFNLPLFSLPAFFFEDGKRTIPAPASLSSTTDRLETWRSRLCERHKHKVGLMWQGNLDNARGRHRSVELPKLAELFTLPLDFYCVSNTVSPSDAAWLREHAPSVHTFTRDIGDFSDTAALIKQLDLLITIDTSIAHLGPALGIPTWVLLPRSADWRWGTAESQTPWYPQSRLFRQQTLGDWQPPVQALKSALANHFGA